MFVKDRFYTRRQIHDEVGGDLEAYLPTKNGQVVCVCLTKKMNPTLPYNILVGDRPRVRRTAEILCAQCEPIPVFIKEAPNKWRYVGLYVVGHSSIFPEDIAPYAKLSGRSTITRIINLEEHNQTT